LLLLAALHAILAEAEVAIHAALVIFNCFAYGVGAPVAALTRGCG